MTDLEAVLALVEKATPGPWEVDGACCADHDTETRAIYHRDNSGPCPRVMEVVEAGCGCHFQPMGESDAALIVAAVNYLRSNAPALREAIRLAEAVKAAPVATVNAMIGDCEIIGMDLAYWREGPLNTEALHMLDGQRVRLVPDVGGGL